MRPAKARDTKSAGRSIYIKILIPVCVLVLIESLLLAGSIFGGGLTGRLNQNARDILGQRVLNRKSYLENEMINSWSQLDLTVRQINEKTEELTAAGLIDPKKLDQDTEGSARLLNDITGEIISMMRSCRTTGGFVVFSNEIPIVTGADGETGEELRLLKSKPGLYFRDLDPASSPSYDNTDLLLERAPTAVVQSINIPMDSGWSPRFEFSEGSEQSYEFLTVPYQAACDEKNQGIGYKDLGYWSGPFVLKGDVRSAIAYSVPLILSDGTVYGVVGVDITLDYLNRIIPYGEIAEDQKGSYILGVERQGGNLFDNVLISGPIYRQAGGREQTTKVLENGKDCRIEKDDQNFCCAVEFLNLYNSNAPFSDQRWALIGAVREQDLFSFSNKVTGNLVLGVLFSLMIGVAGCFLVSRLISRPVETLMSEIGVMNVKNAVKLRRTGIREIDSLEESIENLSRDVIDAATKFTQIVELASVKIAGFEIRRDQEKLFISDGFFEVFNIRGIDTWTLDVETFGKIMTGLGKYVQREEETADQIIFRIPDGGEPIFVKLKYVDDGVRCIGLAEDVTQSMLERDRIAYERDHDLLTGLINRRAFARIMHELFEKEKDALGIAALVMLDLDNLKQINDTFGHECGDNYIQKAAECFVSSVPEHTVVSRISGDEFYLFFYGYKSKEEIRERLDRLTQSIRSEQFVLPNRRSQPVAASGGIAWYPDDSSDYGELLRYSDFAMYKVKQSEKGAMKEFDLGVYNREAYLSQNRIELAELIDQSLVQYYFQPIVSAKDGTLFAYEALMRANMPTLHTASQILELARAEGKLAQIEELTWRCAMETFIQCVEAGKIHRDCRIFINSIASETMTDGQLLEFDERYRGYLDRIVLEMTEEERLDEAGMEIKKRKVREWRASMALDDYGSGYNSERMLLLLSPAFIKVDISIIRGIDEDPDKQKIVQNIVSYAHERQMFIVAEGVETFAEAAAVISMDVDYLQGYWISRPEPEPPQVGDEIKQQIAAMNSGSFLDN